VSQSVMVTVAPLASSRLNLLPSQERTSGPLAARKCLPIRTLRSDCDESEYRDVVLRGVEYPLEYEGGLLAGQETGADGTVRSSGWYDHPSCPVRRRGGMQQARKAVRKSRRGTLGVLPS
jgi:hypothetical protein